MINKIRKPHSLSLLIALCAALFVPAGLLNAQTVVSGNLEVTFEAMPLFSKSNISTGEQVTRMISVTNNGGDTEAVYTSTENGISTGLAEVMELSIAEAASGPIYFDDGFDSFFSPFPVSLGSIDPGDTRTYAFTASLPTTIGNDYQGSSMSFDLVIGFEGSASVSDGGGGGRSDNSDDDDDEVPGEIAGESTSTVPFFWGRGGGFPFDDFIGEVFGATTDADVETGTSTEPEQKGLVANVASAGAALLGHVDCTFFWLLLLVIISMSWSAIEDRFGKNAAFFRQCFTRNVVFTIAYVIGLVVAQLVGILEIIWWVFAALWVGVTAFDYWAHKTSADLWNSHPRNLYFGVLALAFAAVGLFTPLLCVWVPFVIIMLVSILFFFLDE